MVHCDAGCGCGWCHRPSRQHFQSAGEFHDVSTRAPQEVLVGLDKSLRNFMSVDVQPAKDKHGMKMSGYTMPLKYQREGSPVICRSAFRSVPLIINFQHDTLDFSRGVLALLEPMTSPMWKCSRGVHPNVQGASQVQTVSAGVGDRRSTTL